LYKDVEEKYLINGEFGDKLSSFTFCHC
jgi:hypothetical protein